METTTVALETAPEPDPNAAALPSASTAGSNAGLETARTAVLVGTSTPQPAASDLANTASEQTLPLGPSPLPAQVPAAPGSGTGSGGASGSPSGAAAWLSPFDFGFERPGAVHAGETSEHAPAPVSFDPGSSPD
ncbi:hypothetical protein [Arthrobacter sp. B1I2]|uniref:hypothetical protein n=1 Tax=Arthrobacter sp. B1I2 TaxID=3042263 RepID=UPI0027D8161B|nr:hypothetical protein [Arthrobacter sp. B1I2]